MANIGFFLFLGLALIFGAIWTLGAILKFFGIFIERLLGSTGSLVTPSLPNPHGSVLDVPADLVTFLAKAKASYYRTNSNSTKYYEPRYQTLPIEQRIVVQPIDRLIYLQSPILRSSYFESGKDTLDSIAAEEVVALHTPSSLDDLLLGRRVLSAKKRDFTKLPPPPPCPELNKLYPEDVELSEPKLNLPFIQFDGWKGRLFNGLLKSQCEAKYTAEIQRYRDLCKQRADLIEKHKPWNKELRDENDMALKKFNRAKAEYETMLKEHQQTVDSEYRENQAECDKQNQRLSGIRDGYATLTKEGVEGYIDLLLRRMPVPSSIPKEWNLSYSTENKILIIDYRFPYLPSIEILKLVVMKTKSEWKPVNKTEKKTLVAEIHPGLAIRIAYEVARHDDLNAIDAVVVNGWLRYPDRATGNTKETYCSSLFVKKEDLLGLNLESLDPVKSFHAFKGRSAGESFDVVPITPILSLDMEDRRFVDAKEVLSHIQQGENIATMDWEEFEHLVRELFEKLFAQHGAEVKITQASRDLGVDAVIFDPTPIKGGKTVIQAKRYVNVVDVSAVRDLFGTVHNEGANKGILVTTSYYGPESYEFAKDKPLELINGQQLLGLLDQYGYKFRINLDEARVLNKEARRLDLE